MPRSAPASTTSRGSSTGSRRCSTGRPVSDAALQPADPASLIRSRQYRVLLVLAALIGLIVSTASWAFLELVHELEVAVYTDLPHHLGYSTAPTWWPLPWLALAGLVTGLAIARCPR